VKVNAHVLGRRPVAAGLLHDLHQADLAAFAFRLGIEPAFAPHDCLDQGGMHTVLGRRSENGGVVAVLVIGPPMIEPPRQRGQEDDPDQPPFVAFDGFDHGESLNR